MAGRHDLQQVTEELVLTHALGRAAGPALLHDEGDQVARAAHLVGPRGPGGGDVAVSGADDGPQHVVQPVHGEEELAVGLEGEPAQGYVGVCEEEDLAHGAWGEEDVVGLVKAAVAFYLGGLACVEALVGLTFRSGLDVVEVNAQDDCPHDVQDGPHEGVDAVKRPSLAVIVRDGLVKETTDILSFLPENRLELADALQREGIREHSSVSAVFRSLHENQTMACDFLHYSKKPRRLDERVAVVVQHILVRGETVRDEDLCVEKAEIADKGSVWVLLHPLDVQGGRGLCADEIEALAKDGVVVLDSSETTCK